MDPRKLFFILFLLFALHSPAHSNAQTAEERAEPLENDVIKIVHIRFGVKDWSLLPKLNAPYTVHALCKKKGTALVRQTMYNKKRPYKTNIRTRECIRPGDILILEFETIDVFLGFTDKFDLPEE